MATEMSVDEYHEATRAHDVDILAGVMPRLRRNPEKCIGEPKPLAAKTRARLARDICTVYWLLTNTKAQENRDDFHAGGQYTWAQDVPFVLMACGRGVRAGKESLSEESACKRIEAIAQLCDMVHSPEALEAASKYRAVVRHGKERKEERDRNAAPRWTRATASAELERIRAVLADDYQSRVLTLSGDDRIAALLQWIRCCVLFGADHPSAEQTTLQPLRGGCWPQVTFAGLDSVHPKLEATALGSIVQDDDGAIHLKMPECTKTHTDVSVNLTQVCPALVSALDMLKPIAMARHDGWVLPVNEALDGTRTNRFRDATKKLLGVAYTPTDARHLVYCAVHGNKSERAEEARLRGATAEATASSYGDK
jgi:hypothetical protein